jgi:endonuclease/exonuclease/phosphatase family metal-dependent hydrolase
MRRIHRLLAGAAAAILMVTAAAPAQAAGERADRELSVATYNLYLGADLTPLFGATSIPDLTVRAGQVYDQMVRTDFPRRAEAIADQIAEHEPSVVGLQEVALWQRGPLGGDLETTYDFLTILLDALERRGLDYEPVASNTNFSGASPVSATEQVTFVDRDVIIARTDLPSSRLKVANPQSTRFDAVLTLPTGIPGLSFDVPRGYSTVDVKVRGTWVRVANTHLEAFGGRIVRELQGRQLIEDLASSPYPVIVLGDLNTCPQDTDPCTLDSTYEDFLGAGYVDTWAELNGVEGGWTSGQSADLDDPNEITHRIDYVLYRGDGMSTSSVTVIGEEEADRTGGNPSLWPSDHAGVVAVLRLPHP